MKHFAWGFAAALALLAAWPAAAASSVPAQYQGTWVPAGATCESPLRMQIAAAGVALVNGADKQPLGGIEMAGPGYFPPGYRGIEAVLITEFDGHQPLIVTFNAGEKKGVTRADYAPIQPGNAPALKAYNAHIAKLALAKRFPLNKGTLKKCA